MNESLYDIEGNPVAYINYDRNGVIYMWNGTPVAYIHRNMTLYGFNGRHLGWYENGIVRDRNGRIAGYNKLASPVSVKMEPIKGMAKIPPIKQIPELPCLKPMYLSVISHEYLSQFLLRGL